MHVTQFGVVLKFLIKSKANINIVLDRETKLGSELDVS